jgi:hypothetical protein
MDEGSIGQPNGSTIRTRMCLWNSNVQDTILSTMKQNENRVDPVELRERGKGKENDRTSTTSQNISCEDGGYKDVD